jgi:hypothetical protein
MILTVFLRIMIIMMIVLQSLIKEMTTMIIMTITMTTIMVPITIKTMIAMITMTTIIMTMATATTAAATTTMATFQKHRQKQTKNIKTSMKQNFLAKFGYFSDKSNQDIVECEQDIYNDLSSNNADIKIRYVQCTLDDANKSSRVLVMTITV